MRRAIDLFVDTVFDEAAFRALIRAAAEHNAATAKAKAKPKRAK